MSAPAIGTRVTVVAAIDVGIHDVRPFIGRAGVVDHLDYDCGCGQTYPDDPMIGVTFDDGAAEEFWSEELENWDEEPPAEIAALAFVSGAEMQVKPRGP